MLQNLCHLSVLKWYKRHIYKLSYFLIYISSGFEWTLLYSWFKHIYSTTIWSQLYNSYPLLLCLSRVILHLATLTPYTRDNSGYGLSKWEKTLHCNVVSHWLSPYPEWSLQTQVEIRVRKTPWQNLNLLACLTHDQLGYVFQNVISFHTVVPLKCNISI